MAGLVPAIFATTIRRQSLRRREDGRHEAGHDGKVVAPRTFIQPRVSRIGRWQLAMT